MIQKLKIKNKIIIEKDDKLTGHVALEAKRRIIIITTIIVVVVIIRTTDMNGFLVVKDTKLVACGGRSGLIGVMNAM